MLRTSHVTHEILAWLAVAVTVATTSAFAESPKPVGETQFPPHPERRRPEDIKPLPLAPIPDDPPPHEGAMREIPYVIEPPDLLLVEVLEALPGRPISGERLVRPDGKIGLGFYGDLYVRGLTVEQAKEKLVLHLRRYLNDEILGLYRMEEKPKDREEPRGAEPAEGKKPAGPSTDAGRARSETQARAVARRPVQRIARKPGTRRGPSIVARAEDGEKPPVRNKTEVGEAEPLQPRSTPGVGLTLSPGQGIKVTIEIQNPGSARTEAAMEPPEPEPAAEAADLLDYRPVPVEPKDTDRVFVDVTAYNSKVYFVTGDVAKPGRLPITGNETVFDVLNYAGGFIAVADRKKVALVRPPRAGKPSRVYPVDYEAIVERGDPTTNYQIFPGDRIVVGRLDIVQQTIEADRLAAPLQTILTTMHRYTSLMGTLKNLGDPEAENPKLTADQREALLKAWTDFWLQSATRSGGPILDEATLRDALPRALAPPAQAPAKPKR